MGDFTTIGGSRLTKAIRFAVIPGTEYPKLEIFGCTGSLRAHVLVVCTLRISLAVIGCVHYFISRVHVILQ